MFAEAKFDLDSKLFSFYKMFHDFLQSVINFVRFRLIPVNSILLTHRPYSVTTRRDLDFLVIRRLIFTKKTACEKLFQKQFYQFDLD